MKCRRVLLLQLAIFAALLLASCGSGSAPEPAAAAEAPPPTAAAATPEPALPEPEPTAESESDAESKSAPLAESQPETAPSPPPMRVTDPEPEPTPSAAEAEPPDSAINYSWEKYVTTKEIKDGYLIEQTYTFADTWIDSKDAASVSAICEEIGIRSMPVITTIGTYSKHAIDAHSQLLFLFGTAQCKNKTEGWDIVEGDDREVSFPVGLYPIENDAGKNTIIQDASSLLVFYSNEIVDGSGKGRFSMWLNSNQSGVLPFVIALENRVTPNTPQGDKSFEDIRIVIGSPIRPDYQLTPNYPY